MNPRLRIVTEEGRAKHALLGLIHASEPEVPFNARLVITEDTTATRAFKAWFDAAYPDAPALYAKESIVDPSGYPTAYLLTVAEAVGW